MLLHCYTDQCALFLFNSHIYIKIMHFELKTTTTSVFLSLFYNIFKWFHLWLWIHDPNERKTTKKQLAHTLWLQMRVPFKSIYRCNQCSIWFLMDIHIWCVYGIVQCAFLYWYQSWEGKKTIKPVIFFCWSTSSIEVFPDITMWL